MALSFSRPDPSSPAAVGAASFPATRRGYDQGEVRDFLRMVAAELARLQERERFLESELRAMQTRGMSAPGRLDEDTVATLLGEEAARVLTTARDASQQIRERAEEAATRLVKDAAEDASRIREAANLEAVRIREDAVHDAEAEIELSKQQGRDMVVEAREYREKVLAELSRRREAARAQIEALLHGRDRLIGAFERAQVATQSVIKELNEAHDEPEFLVDLSPTTGPVPIVNPNHPSLPTRVERAEQVDVEPVVRIFDHDSDRGTSTEPVESQETAGGEVFPEVPPVSIESTMFTDEEHVVTETVTTGFEDLSELVPEISPGVTVDDVVEDVVEDKAAVADEVVVADDVADTVDPETVDGAAHVDEPVGPDLEVGQSAASTEAPSNIVSIFDRGRRHIPVPDVVPEIAPDDEAPASTVPFHVEPVDEAPARLPAPHGHRPTRDETSDLFSKLREGSTTEVARRSSERVTSGHPVHEKKPAGSEPKSPKPPKKKAVVGEPVLGSDAARVLHPAAPSPTSVDASVFATRRASLDEVATSMARKFKRVLVDEQNDVLQHLQAKRSSLSLDAVLGTASAHVDRYVRAVADDSAVAAGSGVRATKEFGSQARKVRADRVTADVAEIVARSLVGEFRDAVAAALVDGDSDRHAIIERVREVYRRWKTDLLDGVATDAAVRAHCSGIVQSLDQGAAVAWFVHPDERCCSDCEDNSLGGAVAAGHSFPAGSTLAPAHPGCRCLVWPVRN